MTLPQAKNDIEKEQKEPKEDILRGSKKAQVCIS